MSNEEEEPAVIGHLSGYLAPGSYQMTLVESASTGETSVVFESATELEIIPVQPVPEKS